MGRTSQVSVLGYYVLRLIPIYDSFKYMAGAIIGKAKNSSLLFD
jgi:hypothetical protein